MTQPIFQWWLMIQNSSSTTKPLPKISSSKRSFEKCKHRDLFSEIYVKQKYLLLYCFCLCQNLLAVLYLVSVTEASYSNCPKVSISVIEMNRTCISGNYLRARSQGKYLMDAGGRKPYKYRTGNNYLCSYAF